MKYIKELSQHIEIYLFCFLSDYDFIQFVTINNYYYKLRSKKSLIKRYSLTKIINIAQKYMFTNIYYDIGYWNYNKLPTLTKELTITIIKNYLVKIHSLDKIKNLKNIIYEQ